jgi:hypothetical protein
LYTLNHLGHFEAFWKNDHMYEILWLRNYKNGSRSKSGILIGLQGPVWQGTTFMPGPALELPGSALVGHILRYGEIEGIVSSPSVIRDLSRDPEMLRRLQSMKSISWAGGPLDKATGDVLCRHAKLSSAFGSTELGPLLNRASADPTDWDYIWFAEGQGIEFDKWSEKLFELVIRRDINARFQQIFLLHQELEEYFTKDLFEKHSTKQDLWRYSGRKNDMVFLAGGDLLHATEMEQVIIDIQQFSRLSLGVTEGLGHVYSCNWPTI